MSRFLVINLADPDGMGAISSLFNGVSSKRRRHGLNRMVNGQHVVEQVDAFDLIAADKAGTLQRNDPELVDLRNKCLRSKKIYLATHGTPTDVDHAFTHAAGGVPLCTARQLAHFVLAALPQRDDAYNLALVMCYGARTLTYRSTQLDHQGMIPLNDLRTSFAYKLYRGICTARRVRMTARTGAVAFDNDTGVSRVEQEISVDARIDKEELLRGPNVLPSTQNWQQARNQAAIGGNDTYDAFQNLNQQFLTNPHRVPVNPQEQVIKDYQDIMRQKQEYIDIMDAHGDRGKYGKIVYAYTGGQVSIVNKYGNMGGLPGDTLLYRGPLV